MILDDETDHFSKAYAGYTIGSAPRWPPCIACSARGPSFNSRLPRAVGGCLAEHSDWTPEFVTDKFGLFEIARLHITGQAPLYLEFGVFQGRSMRWWSQHLSQPGATMVGFDSFEGLPEDWRHDIKLGHFKTGEPPQIDDSRVSFQVGWFDDTLPHFAVPDHDQLIVNVDSDLYSSALTVLQWAEPYVCPGTLIYFDEFCDRDHERRAFSEWCTRSRYGFRPLGIAEGGVSWLFEVTSP